MDIRPYGDADEVEVVRLWELCGLTRPWNDPIKDIQRKLQVQPELFLVGVVQGNVVATAMGGYDGHRGWIYYLGTHPAHQRQGYARRLVEAVEVGFRQRGCPKVNLMVRHDNLDAVAFYRSLGYSDSAVVTLEKFLEQDG